MKHDCYFIAISWGDKAYSLFFRSLAEVLLAQGHVVVLLVDGSATEAENHEGSPFVFTWPSKRPTRLRDARFLLRLIRKHQPDCMIGNFGAVNIMTVVGWLMRVKCRVAWYRTMSTAIELESHLAQWRIRFLRLRKSIVYSMATHLVANSEAAKKDLSTAFGVPKSKCKVINNALADPANSEGPSAGNASRKGSILCVGRLERSKGQDVLIRAVSLINESAPTTVEFIGDGHIKEELKQLANDLGVAHRCSFLGAVDHSEVFQRIATAGVVVIPSRQEAFGWVSIEAMAIGTPVIASSVGGLTEIVRDGIDGYLVPPNDPEALAQRITQLLDDEDLRLKMSRNARDRFLDRYEISKAASEAASWIEGIVRADVRN